MPSVQRLSIIVPVFNEAANIEATLAPLQAWRGRGLEIIVVDGGSADATQRLAEPLCDVYCLSPAGRAQQMNYGASKAIGERLLFLHADTLLPHDFFETVTVHKGADMVWGFFPVVLSGQHWLLRCVERGMNLRSRLTRVATGDQALWLSRTLWQACGGYPSIRLMEDVALTKQLRAVCPPHISAQPLVTSSRRWETQGMIKTITLMWWLRLKYFLGQDPNTLADQYRPHHSQDSQSS